MLRPFPAFLGRDTGKIIALRDVINVSLISLDSFPRILQRMSVEFWHETLSSKWEVC